MVAHKVSGARIWERQQMDIPSGTGGGLRTPNNMRAGIANLESNCDFTLTPTLSPREREPSPFPLMGKVRMGVSFCEKL